MTWIRLGIRLVVTLTTTHDASDATRVNVPFFDADTSVEFKYPSELSSSLGGEERRRAESRSRGRQTVFHGAMLVERDKFRFAYDELRQDSRECPVHVYVSTADVDSCAAFSILKTMMRSDGIPFSAYPVSGYQELQNLGERLPKDGKNRSIVLINCGGTEDVVTLLGASHTRLGHPILSQSFAGISKNSDPLNAPTPSRLTRASPPNPPIHRQQAFPRVRACSSSTATAR